MWLGMSGIWVTALLLRVCLRRARELGADVLVTLDGDGQHDPTEIPNVVEAYCSWDG